MYFDRKTPEPSPKGRNVNCSPPGVPTSCGPPSPPQATEKQKKDATRGLEICGPLQTHPRHVGHANSKTAVRTWTIEQVSNGDSEVVEQQAIGHPDGRMAPGRSNSIGT